jgi:hypothetical protein
MSLKRILSAGFAFCVLASSAWAVPTITATPSQTVNASGNRVWTIRVIPDGGASLPSSLSVELPFTHFASTSARPMGIIDNAAIDVNTGNAGAANDTWYYNETTAGSGTPLWNTAASGVGDLSQNVGTNPFCPAGAGCPADFNPTTAGHQTEGLYTGGANLFAALGSTIISSGTTSVNTMQIVTQGGGGVLRMGAGVVGQAGSQFNIAAKDFYVPGDFDGNGVVGPSDYSLLLFAFNQSYTTQPNWDGALPSNPNGIVGPADYSNLLFNFNAGQSFGSGAGGEVVGGSDVPEPTSALLVALACGTLGFAGCRRRRS